VKKIPFVTEFAGRMPLNGESEIFWPHTFAIVGDTNEHRTALFDRYGYFRGTSVQGIFYKLFYYRRRTLDDLPRGDAVGHFIRENMNFHDGKNSPAIDNNSAQTTRSRKTAPLT
jgi:hypothetical protein